MPQVEARKRHEYLEAAVSVLDGHLRYFKAGYEALKTLEPFMHQVPIQDAFPVHPSHCCHGPRRSAKLLRRCTPYSSRPSKTY